MKKNNGRVKRNDRKQIGSENDEGKWIGNENDEEKWLRSEYDDGKQKMMIENG